VFKNVSEMSLNDQRQNIDPNLTRCSNYTSEACAPTKRCQDLVCDSGGFVVNISSLATLEAISGGTGYNVADAGSNLFPEALMFDLGMTIFAYVPSCPATSTQSFR
jgi:hypothetical protein